MQRINIELDPECPLDNMQRAMETEQGALIRSIEILFSDVPLG